MYFNNNKSFYFPRANLYSWENAIDGDENSFMKLLNDSTRGENILDLVTLVFPIESKSIGKTK